MANTKLENPVVTHIICLIVVPKRTVYKNGIFIMTKSSWGIIPLVVDIVPESTSVGKIYVCVSRIASNDPTRRFT